MAYLGNCKSIFFIVFAEKISGIWRIFESSTSFQREITFMWIYPIVKVVVSFDGCKEWYIGGLEKV